MHVNQLAKALKTTPDTVRYYTRIGLLKPSKDRSNAYKRYSEDDRKRLRFILCARQMDFTVEQIAQLLQQAEQGREYCPQAAELLQARLEDVQQRLAQTLSLKERLGTALKQWQMQPQKAPTGDMLTELVENFVET
jgi:MerR family Zn(II)-responsive transcriptional regulator of zntA